MSTDTFYNQLSARHKIYLEKFSPDKMVAKNPWTELGLYFKIEESRKLVEINKKTKGSKTHRINLAIFENFAKLLNLM